MTPEQKEAVDVIADVAKAAYDKGYADALTASRREVLEEAAPKADDYDDYDDYISASVRFAMAREAQAGSQPAPAACQCTTVQQDETCPVGYPSLLCDDCDGKGVLPAPAADTGQAVAWRYRAAEGSNRAWGKVKEQRRSTYGRIGMEEQALYAHPAPLDAERVREAVHDAAYSWFRRTGRESIASDIDYFKCNWQELPELRAYVERALGRAALRQKEGGE